MTSFKKFLSLQEQEMISSTVQKAECLTSGEIVPMVVSRSHEYPDATITATLTLTIPAALFFSGLMSRHLWLGANSIWLFISIAALLFLLLYPLMQRSNSFTALFLNPKNVQKEVEKSALAAFYSEKLYKTRDENGILLYLSVFERKIWILADKSVNDKIAQHEWDCIVSELTAGIKKGRQADAICRAVQQVGSILQLHFPFKKDDENELHNLILRDNCNFRSEN